MRVIRGMVVLVAVGCSSSTEVDGELEVRTQQTEYEVGAAVETRIVNHTREVIYVAHCNDRVSLLLERRTGDTWEHHLQVNGPFCLTIYPMGELGIDPGADVTETISIEEGGEFRFVLHGRRASQDFGSVVSVSRPFTMRYAPD